jgi:hypothetical protein
MKTTFVRAVVLTITFAGLTAPSLTAKTVAPTKAIATSSSFVGMPAPMCWPGTGNYCGMQ